MRKIDATKTMNLEIHICVKDVEKKGQYTSRGSGASSVTHSVGLSDCGILMQLAAPNRDLKQTKAAGISWKESSIKH